MNKLYEFVEYKWYDRVLWAIGIGTVAGISVGLIIYIARRLI